MSNDNKILVDNLYSTVEASMKDKKKQEKLFKKIQFYFDRNSDKVFDVGLTNKIMFLNEDKDAIYDASNLDPNNIKLVIKQSKYIKEKWKIMNEPLNTASALILRYFTINNKRKELEVFLTFYSFYFYSSLYHKYLPYGANENVMAYTINNLSNKYLLKQTSSLFKTIQHISITSHDTYYKELMRGEDGDIANYVSALKVRLNSFLKNIKNEYTINYKAKQYVNYDSDSYEEDNFHIADNNSFAIKRIADGAVMKLNTNGADLKHIKLAANINQVSENEIRNVVLNLSENDTAKIQRICELILQLFLFEGGMKVEEVRTIKFMNKCMELYKKSNTNDKLVLEIKSILHEWLLANSEKYRKTNREATLSNFKKAIFTFFVIHIQQSA